MNQNGEQPKKIEEGIIGSMAAGTSGLGNEPQLMGVSCGHEHSARSWSTVHWL